MTTLADNKPRDYETGQFNDLPVVATDIIYEGAAVGENGSGYFRPLVAADNFAGFAVKKADNSAGIAGAINVKVQQKGRIQLSVTGVTAVTDEGSNVYATDDNTFTLTSSGASAIGKIIRWISGTSCIVAFEALSVRSI
jgi:hypothetical protein